MNLRTSLCGRFAVGAFGACAALGVESTADAGTIVVLTDGLEVVGEEGDVVVGVDTIAPDARWTAIDEHAMRNLGQELLDVRPLMHKFDGELEIMARLEGAHNNVKVLRDDEERRLMYLALAFEGFAVERYFQAELPIDPQAEPYRVVIGNQVEVRPWVDAIALDPFRDPSRLDISEEPELAAFRATRDRMLYAPRASIQVTGAPAGSEIRVDGRAVPIADVQAGLPVLPGRHVVAVLEAGRITHRSDMRLDAGQATSIAVPPSLDAIARTESLLSDLPTRVTVGDQLSERLGQLPSPVRLAVRGADGPVLYRYDAGELFREQASKGPSVDRPAAPVEGSIWVGGGAFHDQSFVVMNDGAPDEGAFGGAMVAGVGARWDLADLAGDKASPVLSKVFLGLGVDALTPVGRWQHVPVGSTELRVRPHGYAEVGTGPIGITIGYFAPWHLALGARADLPVADRVHVLIASEFGVVRVAPVHGPPKPTLPQVVFLGLSTSFGG